MTMFLAWRMRSRKGTDTQPSARLGVQDTLSRRASLLLCGIWRHYG